MKTLRLTFEIDTVSEEVDLGPILDALHEISRDLAYILFDTTDLGSEPLSELEESLEQSACAELKKKEKKNESR
tara:strand:+ start:2601 stop:2822 length:222 start_codon:yes stop_codon:yes gene_type:complete